MTRIKVCSVAFSLLKKGETQERFYPYIRDYEGDLEMVCLSPHHGRSFVVDRMDNGRYIVSKGNGLSYTQQILLNTGEFGDDTLGLLLRKDAERDFIMGQEIESLGIKTNHMEYVLELEREIHLPNEHIIKPVEAIIAIDQTLALQLTYIRIK